METQTKKPYRLRAGMIWLGVGLAAAYWVLESAIHALVLDRTSFELIPESGNEWWMRTFTAALFIAFGIYAATVMARLEQARRDQETIQQRLEAALTKVLGGFLSICAQCKKIRDDRGHWVALESYVTGHTEAQFTHTVCPDCFKVLYPDQPASRKETTGP